MRKFRPLRRLLAPLGDRRAATAIEYGLLCALLALGALVAIRGLATGTVGMWGNVTTTVTDAQ